MSSKNKQPKDKESKLIMCKNCHQKILASKMFLHEGFCFRNNVFCKHCERVFLKRDYAYHLKNKETKTSKNKRSTLKESKRQGRKKTQEKSRKRNSKSLYIQKPGNNKKTNYF